MKRHHSLTVHKINDLVASWLFCHAYGASDAAWYAMLHVVTSGVDHKMGTISLRTDRGFFHCCCRQLTNAHVMAWPAAASAVAGHTRARGTRPVGDMNVACAALHEKLICYNQYHDKADAGGKR